jgi:hypothetical protein
VLASAFGTIANGTSTYTPIDTIATTLPLTVGSNLNDMVANGSNLCPTTSGWYQIAYAVAGSTNTDNFVSYQLVDSNGVNIPGAGTSLNTTANDVENGNNTSLVYLDAGNCVHLVASSTTADTLYVAPGGANITAVKIAN